MFTAVSEDGKPGAEPESIQESAVGIPGRWNPAHKHPDLQPAPQPRLTLLVPCQHPDLDVGQRQDGNGFRDPLLQFVLDGCGSEQLGDPNRREVSRGCPQPPPTPQLPAHLPSYHAPPRHRAEPGDPHGPQGHCQLDAAARTSPCSSSPPGLCRPVPVSAAPRQRTPANGQSWVCWQTLMVSPNPSGVPRTGHKPSSGSWVAILSSPPCL